MLYRCTISFNDTNSYILALCSKLQDCTILSTTRDEISLECESDTFFALQDLCDSTDINLESVCAVICESEKRDISYWNDHVSYLALERMVLNKLPSILKYIIKVSIETKHVDRRTDCLRVNYAYGFGKRISLDYSFCCEFYCEDFEKIANGGSYISTSNFKKGRS